MKNSNVLRRKRKNRMKINVPIKRKLLNKRIIQANEKERHRTKIINVPMKRKLLNKRIKQVYEYSIYHISQPKMEIPKNSKKALKLPINFISKSNQMKKMNKNSKGRT